MLSQHIWWSAPDASNEAADRSSNILKIGDRILISKVITVLSRNCSHPFKFTEIIPLIRLFAILRKQLPIQH